MASACVYYKGKRIKTDILVSGWIRNIKRRNKVSMPRDIIELCFKFWFIDICDEWDKKYIDESDVTLQGQCITMKDTWNPESGAQRSFYGCYSVEEGVYEWIIRFNTEMSWICIGIIEDDQELLKKHAKEGNRYKDTGRGWFLREDGVFCCNQAEYNTLCESFQAKGSIVSTRVDMNAHELSYKINEQDWKIATKQLKQVKYRFVVTMVDKGTQIELL